MSRRAPFTILILLLALGGAAALRLALGTHGLSWTADAEVRALRLHRIALACTCGSALAVAGVVLQTLLRNPLASPDLTGVASGSGLGVLLAAFIAHRAGQTLSPTLFGPAALAGALVTLSIVALAARRSGRSDPVAMVLIGVSIGILAAALGMLLQHLMPPDPARPATRWLIGSLDEQTPTRVVIVAATLVILSTGAITAIGPSLDAASLSDEEAASVGVRIGTLRAFMFVLAGVLTSIAVVLGGPIGFVGLVCPHVVRSLAGPSHRPLAISTALAGALMLVLADIAVRCIDLDYGRLPIGVVTAVVGAPILIIMLRRGVGAWGGPA